MLRARDQFRGESAFATYLFTIARHELYRVLAERRRDLGRIDIEIGALAEILQSPAITIRSRLHRARIAPRDRMLREPDTAKVAETLETLDAWAKGLGQ